MIFCDNSKQQAILMYLVGYIVSHTNCSLFLFYVFINSCCSYDALYTLLILNTVDYFYQPIST